MLETSVSLAEAFFKYNLLFLKSSQSVKYFYDKYETKNKNIMILFFSITILCIYKISVILLFDAILKSKYFFTILLGGFLYTDF